MRFAGKVAIVTGASDGIGRAAAEMLAQEGATVIAVARTADRLSAVVEKINQAGGHAIAHRGDATSPADVDAIVDAARHTQGRIDILVNGVGGSTIVEQPSADVENMSLGDWRKLIAFNLEPVFLFCRAVMPIMKAQRGGKIVNLSSISSRGNTGLVSGAYAAAKSGICALTHKLAVEGGAFGINVNAVSPGFTLTERMKPTWERLDAKARSAILARIPLGRIGTAADQARVICFLASEDAAFLTGLTIDVTGGQ
jgi:NAD(P)-dependent dehydrogenase (short-subunit alcohol dehydrogenase family)